VLGPDCCALVCRSTKPRPGFNLCGEHPGWPLMGPDMRDALRPARGSGPLRLRPLNPLGLEPTAAGGDSTGFAALERVETSSTCRASKEPTRRHEE
jgi:hypothetical protein